MPRPPPRLAPPTMATFSLSVCMARVCRAIPDTCCHISLIKFRYARGPAAFDRDAVAGEPADDGAAAGADARSLGADGAARYGGAQRVWRAGGRGARRRRRMAIAGWLSDEADGANG